MLEGGAGGMLVEDILGSTVSDDGEFLGVKLSGHIMHFSFRF